MSGSAAPPNAPSSRPREPLLAEALAVLVGIVLRVALLVRYVPARLGYDRWVHVDYVAELARLGTAPPIGHSYITYHPPAYYWVMAQLANLHIPYSGMGILFGCVRLVLCWVAIRRQLKDPWARVAALVALSVIPCAVWVDGMISNEVLHTLLAAAIVVALPTRAEAASPPAWGRVAALGVLTGLALATKGSALTWLVAGLALFVVATWRRRLWVVPVLAVLVAAPSLYRAYSQTQRLFPTAFEGDPRRRAQLATIEKVPIQDRRPASYVLCLPTQREWWDAAYFPRDITCFWSVAIASSFNDYYGYYWVNDGQPSVAPQRGHLLPVASLGAGRWAVGGGIVITLTLLFGIARLVPRWRDEPALLVCALAAVGAVTLQLAFAWRFPVDDEGMVKGHYLQFVAPAMALLYGYAFERHAGSRALTALLVANGLALAGSLVYVIALLVI